MYLSDVEATETKGTTTKEKLQTKSDAKGKKQSSGFEEEHSEPKFYDSDSNLDTLKRLS